MRMFTGTVLLTTTLILLSSSCLQADDNIPQLAMPLPPGSAGEQQAVAVPMPAPPVSVIPAPVTPAAGSMPVTDNTLTELKLPGDNIPPPASTASNDVPQLSLPPESTPPAAGPEKKEEKAAGSEESKPTSKAAGTHKTKKKKSSKKSTKHSKHKKSKKAAEQSKPVPPITYIIKDRLPEEVYKKSYDKYNRHLPVAYYEKDYDTLLFTAIANNDINGMRSILNTGRDVNMTNAAGDTPLLAAIKSGSIDAVHLLVKRNANRAIEDRQGLSAMQLAEKIGNPQIIAMLSDNP